VETRGGTKDTHDATQRRECAPPRYIATNATHARTANVHTNSASHMHACTWKTYSHEVRLFMVHMPIHRRQRLRSDGP
jgi:hypothetical protein